MEKGILDVFGVNVPLLLAQLVNFALLLFLLQRFLYKPLMKFLDERKTKIQKSLEQAKEVEQAYEKTKALREEVLTQARADSEEIIKKAAASARDKADEILSAAEAQQQRALEDARAVIEAERAEAMNKLRSQVATLVVEATEKILEREFKEADEERVIKQAAKLLTDVQ